MAVGIVDKKDFNSCASKLNYGECGTPLRSARTSDEVTVITCGCGQDRKIFNSIFSLIKCYGECGITVITCGCGPYKEGSTPSFRHLSGVFDSAIRTPWNVALNKTGNFSLFANSRRCSPSAGENLKKRNEK